MSSENVRKRKATTKALESNEALTKRLRDNHGGHPSYNTSSTPILSNPPTREGSQATTHNVGEEENSLEFKGTETYGEERPNEQTETEDEPEVEDSQSKLGLILRVFLHQLHSSIIRNRHFIQDLQVTDLCMLPPSQVCC